MQETEAMGTLCLFPAQESLSLVAHRRLSSFFFFQTYTGKGLKDERASERVIVARKSLKGDGAKCPH